MKWATRYQKLEGLTLLLVATYFYFQTGFYLIWFVVLFFTVDIFMVGYFVSSKLGAHIYNIGHSLILPQILLITGLVFKIDLLVAVSFIWLAHIGLDRALGYGLKLETSFHHTHLGHIGRK